MLKHFRKIHNDLLNKNKIGKYLKYTIGEILLVTVGILLALQINNVSSIGHALMTMNVFKVLPFRKVTD